MITKIDTSGYVHVRGSKSGGIYEISSFDDDELRENRCILLGKLQYCKMVVSEKEKIEDSIKKINAELEKRINAEAERRR